MKYDYQFFGSIVILFLIIYNPLLAGGGHNSGGSQFHPDSLFEVTLTGTVIIDSSFLHPMYSLDENGDLEADYFLNFGPYWYKPADGNTVRPQQGDVVTINGSLHDFTQLGIPVVVVYEINGEFWRNPYFASWNDIGNYQHGGGHHQGGCSGYAFGWNIDLLATIEISGTVLIDSTFFMEHYFLDENEDGLPDYFLNFGPWWYEPASGAIRPTDGDQISIVGGQTGDSTYVTIFVYEINGLVWRDSTLEGTHFGGSWIHETMQSSAHITTPTDPEDWMHVNPGWHQTGGGHHGGSMMMPDSIFCQILEVFPQNIPNSDNQNHFAAYEVGLFFPDGQNGMWQGGSCGGHLNFANPVQFQLHYTEMQMHRINIDEKSIKVKYWDDSSGWIEIAGLVVDPVKNTVSFSTTEISNFFILTGEQVTDISESENSFVVNGFTLEQNYPNPFNPSTTIEFNLKENGYVVFSIFNIVGEKLFDLADGIFSAGVHKVSFEAGSLPSGIYFYQLNSGGQSIVRKMTLMR